MLIPSLSPRLLCSWVTGQRQKWLSRMLTDIHSTGHLSHLIIKVPLSLSLINSPGTQISSYPVSKDLYPHTTCKTLLPWILGLCPWSFHPTTGHISWMYIQLVIWHLSFKVKANEQFHWLKLFLLLKNKSVCLTHSEAKQEQKVRVRSPEGVLRALQRGVVHALRTPNSLKALSEALF